MTGRQSLSLIVGRATAHLPLGVNRVLWRALRLGQQHPIVKLSGMTQAGVNGSMIVAGLGPAEDYLPSLFFADVPERVSLGGTSVLQLARRLGTLRNEADLTVARVDGAVGRSSFGKEYLRVPEWVRSTAAVPENMAALSNRSNSLRQDLRLVRKYGYTVVESREEADVQEFYTTMFRPHTLARHGSAEYLKSLPEITAAWRKGLLLWIMLEGRRVAGIIVSQRLEREAQGSVLKLEALGTLAQDTSLLKKGVLAAAYFHSFEYAKKVGSGRIDFGATRPSLNDSLLRYKRKWGAKLDSQSSNYYRLLTYWPHLSPSVAAMLNIFPLVFRRGDELNAVHANPAVPLPSILTVGLSSVYVAGPGSTDVSFRREMPSAMAPPRTETEAAGILSLG